MPKYHPYPNPDYIVETIKQEKRQPLYMLCDPQAAGPRYGYLRIVCGPIASAVHNPETDRGEGGQYPQILAEFTVFQRQPRERIASSVDVDIAGDPRRMSPGQAGALLERLGFDPKPLYDIVKACGWPIPEKEVSPCPNTSRTSQ